MNGSEVGLALSRRRFICGCILSCGSAGCAFGLQPSLGSGFGQSAPNETGTERKPAIDALMLDYI